MASHNSNSSSIVEMGRDSEPSKIAVVGGPVNVEKVNGQPSFQMNATESSEFERVLHSEVLDSHLLYCRSLTL